MHSPLPNQHYYGVQSIEQKVRAQLHLECIQPRLTQLVLQLRRAQFQARRLTLSLAVTPVIDERVVGAHDQPIHDQVQVKVDWQNGPKRRCKRRLEPRQSQARRYGGKNRFFRKHTANTGHQMKEKAAPPKLPFDWESAGEMPND